MDFAKDIYYCYTIGHINQNLNHALWVSALFAMGYRFINIVAMTKYEYIKSFGVGELDNIEERR